MFRRKLIGAVGATGTFAAILFAHASGPDVRHTAAPGDDPLSCATAGCHTSSAKGGPINAAGGSVTAAFSGGANYTPGGPAVNITVTVSDPVNKVYGFQMTARLDSNKTNGQAGSFNPSSGNFVLCDNGSNRRGASCPGAAPVEFIEHSMPATAPWTFTWTPPATNVGDVDIYVAGNAVNNNGLNDGGDHVYTNSYVLHPVVSNPVKPAITSVNSATDFGAFSNFAPGSWLEVKGTNLSSTTRQWAGADFSGSNAPTALDGVSATVNGKAAFVYYVSPTQINIQAPADTATGSVPVVVKSGTQASDPVNVTEAAVVPGVLAPAAFKIGGKQYLVAQFSDGVFVGTPNLIAGAAFRTAKPGDALTVYGIGFGDVTPPILPGVIARQSNLNTQAGFAFGQTNATMTYSGLSPGFVGLYQFNFVVPKVAVGDQQINVTLGGQALPQTFFLTVGN